MTESRFPLSVLKAQAVDLLIQSPMDLSAYQRCRVLGVPKEIVLAAAELGVKYDAAWVSSWRFSEALNAFPEWQAIKSVPKSRKTRAVAR